MSYPRKYFSKGNDFPRPGCIGFARFAREIDDDPPASRQYQNGVKDAA
ncbi:hypothetical protein MPS_5187 [Mycobacterium pseudoshottsii JCM 15466]|nr:hypothetical protein MPS_5187 [Mycobacterium pseudoshottsii JCM 15466]